MILVLEGAERVRDPLERVRQRMREVVHRIDAPVVASAMVRGVADPVQRRIPHVEVRRRHVDLRAQDMRAVRELARAHPGEEIDVLLGRSIAVRAVPPRFGQRAAVLPHLVGRQTVDVRQTAFDQRHGELIQAFEIIRRVQLFRPLESEPPDVLFDRIHVLDVFLDRIGVVESQVAGATVLHRHTEVEADRFGVADVEIAVGFRWKSRRDTSAVLPGRDVVLDDCADEVDRRGRRGGVVEFCAH